MVQLIELDKLNDQLQPTAQTNGRVIADCSMLARSEAAPQFRTVR
jgi:hypothetical protein